MKGFEVEIYLSGYLKYPLYWRIVFFVKYFEISDYEIFHLMHILQICLDMS